MFAAETNAASVPGTVGLGTEPTPGWKQIVEPVEPFLDAVSRRLAQEVDAFEPEIVPYAEYALNGNGKQLRPVLLGLTSSALGGTRPEHITAAVIIEMVHLATLVHDDVMDEAEIRRGRPTMAANWGNELAVLFGDCLFANSLKLAASFPTTEVCRAVSQATHTVCAGEILQNHHRRDINLSRQKYFRILEMKTAELFALSCDMAAFLSDATDEQRKALKQFGLAFGTAYQLYDDCVDLFGSEVAAGKSLGTDLAKGKLTLPILLLWERANATDRERLRNSVTNWQPSALPWVSSMLARHETLTASLECLRDYLSQAQQSLQVLPASPGRSALHALTEYLAQQTSGLRAVPGNGI
jgi:octaprenyl-diphosphate synthase